MPRMSKSESFATLAFFHWNKLTVTFDILLKHFHRLKVILFDGGLRRTSLSWLKNPSIKILPLELNVKNPSWCSTETITQNMRYWAHPSISILYVASIWISKNTGEINLSPYGTVSSCFNYFYAYRDLCIMGRNKHSVFARHFSFDKVNKTFHS